MGTKHEELNPLTDDDLREILGDMEMNSTERVILKLKQAFVVVCKPKDGCLGKAAPDEPLFILRGQDVLAPFMVRQWSRMFYMLNTYAMNRGTMLKPDLKLTVDPAVQTKHDEAMRLAQAMDNWRIRKLPD